MSCTGAWHRLSACGERLGDGGGFAGGLSVAPPSAPELQLGTAHHGRLDDDFGLCIRFGCAQLADLLVLSPSCFLRTAKLSPNQHKTLVPRRRILGGPKAFLLAPLRPEQRGMTASDSTVMAATTPSLVQTDRPLHPVGVRSGLSNCEGVGNEVLHALP